MSLIKFLLFRNKKTSILGARKYGEKEHIEPKETSILASRKYGGNINKIEKKQEESTLKK